MREIKFRLWLKNYEETKGTMYYRCMPCSPDFKEWMVALDGSKPEYFDGNLDVGTDCEIMQYTGLKDKNGRDIYEGDLLKIIKGLKISEVKYEADYGGYICEWGYSKDQHHVRLTCDEALEAEIIGNIHQLNPTP